MIVGLCCIVKNENKYLKINTQGVATRCNLKNDSSSHKYLNHTAHITCNVIRDYSKNMTNISAYGEYYHQEKKVEVEPSFSIGADGSVSLSGSVKSSMHEMTPNVQAILYF